MVADRVHHYRRIVLQIDASTHCRDTLLAATEIAALLGAELKGVFVEDQNVLSVGKLDFVREVSLSSRGARTIDSPTLEAQLRALANSARRQLQEVARQRQVSLEFLTIREVVDTEHGDLLAKTDLVITEGTGRSHGRFHTVAHLADQSPRISNRPTLYLKGGQSLPNKFVLLCDSVKSAERLFAVARSLSARHERKQLFVPCVENGSETGDLEKNLKKLAGLYDGDAEVSSPLPQSSGKIIDWLGSENALLILDAEGPLLEDTDNRDNFTKSRFPLLIV